MPFQQLYKNIFNKEESDAGGTAMLHQLVKEYPYFSLAHFFILKNTAIKDASYNSIAAKTALHFNNPFLLQEQLHKSEVPILKETINETFLVTENTANIETDVVPVIQAEVVETIETISVQDTPTPEATKEVGLKSETFFEEKEQANVKETINETFLVTENTANIETDVIPVVSAEVVETVETIPVQETSTTEPAKNADLNSEALFEEKAPAGVIAEPVLFQPLFASDYFASQGIKLSQEAMPSDKLGKQLKSFTDWLKTMKKVHASKLPDSIEAMNVSMQTLAEKSNKEEEVITETMAEVYLQQGKRHKAKEIYEKLSLLNPSKIAYFAAKLDQIQ